jgi:hypothetical protein
MAFDPSLPQEGTEIDAVQMRSQLNGLKALIDAVPAGPPGPEGPAFSNVQIGSVITGMPGTGAAVSVNVNGSIVELSFTIPAGDAGPMGEVSSATLAGEIAGTARDPIMVTDLMLAPSDPPTQADLLAVIAKFNELLAALRR